MLLLRVFVVLLAFLGVPIPVIAGEIVNVDVAVDEAHLIRLGTDAAQLIVGNPSIADVISQNKRLLVVTGKSYGSTNLIVLNAAGVEILTARLAVSEGRTQFVRLYKGTQRQTLHCAPACVRTLTIGDDKGAFEQLADNVSKKFSVANSAAGNGGGN